MTEKMSEVGLEALDLSVRSYNCLKRAGYNTVGDVFDGLASGKELRSIRNCGTTSAREIMEKLFLFQYESLSEKNREWYLLEVVVLNAC
jgi:DNA-directed RNA polymerase subunit alpha